MAIVVGGLTLMGYTGSYLLVERAAMAIGAFELVFLIVAWQANPDPAVMLENAARIRKVRGRRRGDHRGDDGVRRLCRIDGRRRLVVSRYAGSAGTRRRAPRITAAAVLTMNAASAIAFNNPPARVHAACAVASPARRTASDACSSASGR